MNDPRRMLDASLHDGGQTMTRLMASWQRAIADAQSTTDPLTLAMIPWRLAAEQTACLMLSSSIEFDRWFGGSAQALTQTPRVANDVARRLGLPANFDLADDVVYAPLATIENLRANWSHVLRQWVETARGAPPID